ncbi:MAG TPA: protein translocase subunit SecF [Candidatus Limnocylindrales bacterium]|nr:protein translocase subunit SecF [Candidatus Limnocylindrales bacterium]
MSEAPRHLPWYFDVVGKRRLWFAFSALITIPGLIFILLTPLTGGAAGLKFSIDYTGGTIWQIRFEDPNVAANDVQRFLGEQGLEGSTVTRTGTGFLEIRTLPIGIEAEPSPTPAPSTSAAPSASASSAPSASPAASASPGASPSPDASASPAPTPAAGNTELPTQGRLGEVRRALEAEFGPIAEQAALTTIGPVVTADLIGQALILIAVGSLAILVWMGYRFRDFKFGASAIAALLHDVVVVIGVFAILGTFLGVEIDALFVTAMLTVIGFSVHDTIVVFDRIRENKARHAGEPFDRIVNHSILQTAGRSITTSLTVVITLLSLILFAGEAIGEFGLALLLGIVSGTYSSIFNAAQILVVWQHWEDRRRERAMAQPQSTRRAPA